MIMSLNIGIAIIMGTGRALGRRRILTSKYVANLSPF
jgi:hypothetical protein